MFTKPSQIEINAAFTRMRGVPFSYPQVGYTKNFELKTPPPEGFLLDRNKIELGSGAEVFKKAKAALATWEMFKNGWTHLKPSSDALTTETMTVMTTKIGGLWWLNVCRIVYLIEDNAGDRMRAGFAYGTLPEHAECGEERFLIEWDKATDRVTYEIMAFSKPRHFLTKLAKPWARRLQDRFAKESLEIMRAAAK